MAKSAIEELFEEAIQIGEKKGLEKGREEGLEKGLLDGVRNRIIQNCRRRFGSPHTQIEAVVRAESNQDRLRQINDRVSSASSWEEILKD